jgi:AcrR family transcriptional regulator
MTNPKVMGRPSLIARDDIARVALEILPQKITMTAVATRLGVSASALYRHVRNRDDLMRLVTEARLAKRPPMTDSGQHWSDLARQTARSVYHAYSGNPALLIEYIAGSFPPASELPSMERFVAALQSRGFTTEEALALARDLRAIALGSAVFANAQQTIDREEGIDTAVDGALTLFKNDELPLLRASLGAYKASLAKPNWEESLEALLRGVAAARGETVQR